MSRKEVSDLLEKIQAYRQSFLITNADLSISSIDLSKIDNSYLERATQVI